eukprot:COSAG02_NODE_12689_length_1509_cov_1.573759_3_plen_131_part_00
MGASDDEAAGGAEGPALPFAVASNAASIPVPQSVPGELRYPLAHKRSSGCPIWPSYPALARVGRLVPCGPAPSAERLQAARPVGELPLARSLAPAPVAARASGSHALFPARFLQPGGASHVCGVRVVSVP